MIRELGDWTRKLRSMDLVGTEVIVEGPYGGAFRRAEQVASVVAELEALGHEIVPLTLPEYPVSEMLVIPTYPSAGPPPVSSIMPRAGPAFESADTAAIIETS